MIPLDFQPTSQTPARSEGWVVVAMHVTFDSQKIGTHHGKGRDIGSIVADHESNPKRAAALSQARKKLAAVAYGRNPPNQSLAALRLAKGLSQAGLAQAIGTQQSYIARIEKNGSDLRAATIKKLANVLGVTCDQIIAAVEDIHGN